ncbi:Triosephosphate isomerase [Frondihabitans sp. 762G35]|uniref:triose-phosphate isomerase family protein n=1 Tax=Frondihabitans sp. 762G35 TaxID=1446794 RepID=UPI000D21EDE0|nr:triose-phosphate isomerase family protein [Frondihabitans sp. 762G35]ARC58311.1 Triosephosphate isomerase [Frondihabitans sp. 762G35]
MTLIGVSLKMYFGHAQTIEWCRAVRAIADDHEAIASGAAELFVLPTFPSIPATREILAPVVGVGAQDIATDDAGAFTGEVSGSVLAELGCTLAEIGHAERRRLFAETDEQIGRKVAAAFRNGLTPLVCLGEVEQGGAEAAVAECLQQLGAALAGSDRLSLTGPLVVAYEPVWAIGQPTAAPVAHVRDVGLALGAHLRGLPGRQGSRVLYGGSAGPGLLTEVGDAVDGLFLGRFAHDPEAVRSILDEVPKLSLS